MGPTVLSLGRLHKLFGGRTGPLGLFGLVGAMGPNGPPWQSVCMCLTYIGITPVHWLTGEEEGEGEVVE